MRRSLARFRGPKSSGHIRSLADFITNISGFRFSVYTGGGPYIFKRQAAAIEEVPKRRPSRIHITLRGKLVEHLADGHVRRGLDEPENVITVRIELQRRGCP